jgi:hypothetical protein
MKNLWNDDITQSIASTVSDVLEGKVKQEDVSKYIKSNSTGGFDVVDAKENVVKSFGKRDEAEGYALKNLARLQEVEEPKAKGEKDFKDKHVVKKSGEKEDGSVVKETKLSEEEVEEDKENGYVNIPVAELSDKQKEYQKVFKAAMKKFGVKSPADFKDDAKKKEFFDYIDKNYKADKESD